MLVERKASCHHVADASLTRLKLIWPPPTSSLKISKISEKCIFWQKAPVQWVNGLTKQTTLYKSWNASCKWKQINMKEAFGRFEFGLTEMCFPSPGSRHKYELTMILRQHYHYIGCRFTFFYHKCGALRLVPFPRSGTVLVYWAEWWKFIW